MNWVDLGILAVLLLGALTGLRQGFIVEVAGILGAILAFAVARAEYRPVRSALSSVLPHTSWLTTISYLIVFLVVWGAILIGARMIRMGIRMLMLGMVDRLGGAIVGVLQSALILELLLYIGKHGPSATVRSAVKQSSLAPTFLSLVPVIHHLFPNLPH